jgi:hypothetical protein
MNGSLFSFLEFVKEEKTITKIAEESGIPYTTLYYYNTGVRNLPSQYEDTLRNYYGREAYRRLKASGASVTQSNRFRWYQPERVRNVINTYQEVRETMIDGALADLWGQYDGSMTFQNFVNKNYDSIQERMTTALQNSRKPYEDIKENYR